MLEPATDGPTSPMRWEQDLPSQQASHLQQALQWQKDSDLYRSLNTEREEFRLLVVHAGQDDDLISGHLQPASFKTKPYPQYETISYCWGDQSSVTPIRLNGRIVSAPASSVAAVKCVRLPEDDRVIWIDALCIDQADLDERAHQVAMMASIYSKSTGNLIYLGEEDKYSERAIGSIHKVLDDIRARTDNFQRTKGTPFEPRNDRHSYEDVDCGADQRALASLFSNSWFR